MAESGIPVPSRRTLLACAGAACAAVLAGCGRGSASSGGMAAGQSAQASSTATVPAGWDSGAVAALGASPAQGRSQPPAPAQVPALAATSDVPVGGGMILSTKKVVITQPQAGSFKAFTAICTHQGCTVSTVSGGTINCPCHGSKFSVASGSVVAGPAPSPLAPVAIKVQGTSIVRA